MLSPIFAIRHYLLPRAPYECRRQFEWNNHAANEYVYTTNSHDACLLSDLHCLSPYRYYGVLMSITRGYTMFSFTSSSITRFAIPLFFHHRFIGITFIYSSSRPTCRRRNVHGPPYHARKQKCMNAVMFTRSNGNTPLNARARSRRQFTPLLFTKRKCQSINERLQNNAVKMSPMHVVAAVCYGCLHTVDELRYEIRCLLT